jgi:hypothetical protein
MNRAERLRRCYFNQPVDRPAVYSRTSFPKDDPSYDQLKNYILTHSELKQGWNASALEPGLPTETSTEPFSENFSRRVTVLHTPKGPLTSSFLTSLKGLPGMQETYFLKTRADAEKYLSLPTPEILGDLSGFFAAQAQIGDRGIVDIRLGTNPGGFTATLFGTETFALMSVTDRDILHALCQRQMTLLTNRLKFMIDQNVGPFFSMLGEEYIAPPIHSPADFYDFNVTYNRPLIDLIHDADGRIHIHCHGSIKKVFQGFIDMGADVLHPFEPPPMGDITALQAKEFSRGKLCLEGNIQIHRMYEATPEDVRRETEALILDAFDDSRGLIVSTSASPYIRGEGQTCFPQYKAMIDTVVNWKK